MEKKIGDIMKKRKTQLWKCVKEIITNNYQEILKNSTDLRDSYYIVRDQLAKYLEEGKLSKEEYDCFAGTGSEKDSTKAYGYFTQDIWGVWFEKKFGIPRPDAKPVGVIIWKNYEYTIDKLKYIDSQARGFIYVEKQGIAEKLIRLSNFGWCIVAAQGQATRNIRKMIKQDGRPCLIIHDFDPDGEIIAQSIKNKTKRTKHLDLALTDRAIDLGLNEEQADYLIKRYNVPTQPLPTKWEKKWKRNFRIELSAFVVIKTESGNAVFDFFTAEMKRKGIPLSLKEIPKTIIYKEKVEEEIKESIGRVVSNLLEGYEIQGTACSGSLSNNCFFNLKENEPELVNSIRRMIEKTTEKMKWVSEKEMESNLMENIYDDFLVRK